MNNSFPSVGENEVCYVDSRSTVFFMIENDGDFEVVDDDVATYY